MFWFEQAPTHQADENRFASQRCQSIDLRRPRRPQSTLHHPRARVLYVGELRTSGGPYWCTNAFIRDVVPDVFRWSFTTAARVAVFL